jgi:hypothetical protein
MATNPTKGRLNGRRREVRDHAEDIVLPGAEFTTFRAAARRHLAPREFERLDRLYQHAAAGTDAWLGEHQHYLTHRQDHLDAEQDLKRNGLIHTEHGPHRPEAHVDVLYSLRYCNTPEDH